jgi:hypothetical protein
MANVTTIRNWQCHHSVSGLRESRINSQIGHDTRDRSNISKLGPEESSGKAATNQFDLIDIPATGVDSLSGKCSEGTKLSIYSPGQPSAYRLPKSEATAARIEGLGTFSLAIKGMLAPNHL